MIAEAHAKNLDYFVMRINLFLIAFAQGDREGMRRQLEWAKGKPAAGNFAFAEIQTDLFEGRLPEARVAALRDPNPGDLGVIAGTYAALGACGRATALVSGHEVPRQTWQMALADAVCGDGRRAEAVADAIASDPRETALDIRAIGLPILRALVDIKRGKYADARANLEPARPYEFGHIGDFGTVYTTGLSYLGERRAPEAIAEFEKIVNRRSVNPASPFYPLAHLGLARAAALAGDKVRSRAAYEQLFALWKDADNDLPALLQARQEYSRLQ